ncbi:MAG: hypothetical protein DRN20_05010 [Thermoplasmata archaeon]|nr:MAG: hypothetical protein DRN20_05010 [Thermoplasmata archaeon]
MADIEVLLENAVSELKDLEETLMKIDSTVDDIQAMLSDAIVSVRNMIGELKRYDAIDKYIKREGLE